MSRATELMDEMERLRAFEEGGVPRSLDAADDWKSLRAEVERLEARIAELKVEFAGPVSAIEARALERYAKKIVGDESGAEIKEDMEEEAVRIRAEAEK